jgi:ribokinase
VRAQIVVVGSCNLDLVVGVDHVPQVGETVMGSDVRRYPGGKGANQAVAAARLGCRVAMVGRVGDDEAGALLREALESDGVETSGLLTTAGVPSGTALIAVQTGGDNAIVVSPGANARVTPHDVAIPVVADAELVLMQGEVPIEAVLEAARVAAGRVIWNPAPAPTEVPLEMLEQVDIVVPNQTELAELTGHRGPIAPDIAVDLARRLPSSAVVVTLGADGALVVVDEDAVHVAAPRVTPVDTTAAGDAFCGALAMRLAADDDLVAAARWACRVGAAATLRRGAQPSLPTTAEVEAMVE